MKLKTTIIFVYILIALTNYLSNKRDREIIDTMRTFIELEISK